MKMMFTMIISVYFVLYLPLFSSIFSFILVTYIYPKNKEIPNYM